VTQRRNELLQQRPAAEQRPEVLAARAEQLARVVVAQAGRATGGPGAVRVHPVGAPRLKDLLFEQGKALLPRGAAEPRLAARSQVVWAAPSAPPRKAGAALC